MTLPLVDYFFFLLSLEPARPAMPVPMRSIVAGSGTGVDPDSLKVKLSISNNLAGFLICRRSIPDQSSSIHVGDVLLILKTLLVLTNEPSL